MAVTHNSYHTFFLNLANKLKIDIISALRERGGEMSVNEIVKKLGAEQSKVSHSLATLKACNIVMSRKSGKKRMYSLNKETIDKILDIIDHHAKTFCNHECKNCKFKGKH